MPDPVNVFLAYAYTDRKDKALIDDLLRHLTVLQRQGLIRIWHPGQIPAGTDWEEEIEQRLKEAQIILFFLSPAFIASDANYKLIEMAMDQREKRNLTIIPILLRPTYLKSTPLGDLVSLPRNGIPLTQWIARDLAILEIGQEIRQRVAGMVGRPLQSINTQLNKVSNQALESELEQTANDLRESYTYIRNYESIIRLASDPAERAEARQAIEKQRILAQFYANKYQQTADQLGIATPSEIEQISTYLNDNGFSTIS